jgi:hypothetical protein
LTIKKRRRVPFPNFCVIVSMILILSLSLFSSVISTNNPCSQCHQNRSETCAFDPTDAQSRLPSEINTQSSSVKIAVKITGDGSSFFYRIASLQVLLESVQGNIAINNPRQTMADLYPGETPVFQWRVNGLSPGSDTLRFKLSARNPHHNLAFSDTYSYSVVITQGSGSPGSQPAVEPSMVTLLFHENGGTLILYIKRPLENLKVSAPQGITIQPDSISSAQTGDEITLSFSSISKTPIHGMITIIWVENNNPGTLTVPVEYNITPRQPIDYYSLADRITALLLLGS